MSLKPEELAALPQAKTGRRIAVRLKPKGLQALRHGHPWVFEDSILKLSHEGEPGDVCALFDEKGVFAGAGLYDPVSNVRVKALVHGRQENLDATLIKRLAAQALAAREGAIPPETNAFRAVNGDSDGFPGIVFDLYADVLATKLYSAAWLPWLRPCVEAFFELRPELKRLAVRLSREIRKDAAKLYVHDGMVLPRGSSSEVVFLENGIKFEAVPAEGQKTGFFLDQRENRAEVGRLCQGRDAVLNLFSYSGGFSLYAARAGAKKVLSVDFSRQAVEAMKRNFQLNAEHPGVARCEHEEIAADAFDALQKLHESGSLFDVVVVDPPSFAKAEAEKPGALRSYARLCRAALKTLRKNGVLVFASCSSRVSADELFETIHGAAASAGRPLKEFKRTSHAPDHPAKFKESSYLKCLYARA